MFFELVGYSIYALPLEEKAENIRSRLPGLNLDGCAVWCEHTAGGCKIAKNPRLNRIHQWLYQ